MLAEADWSPHPIRFQGKSRGAEPICRLVEALDADQAGRTASIPDRFESLVGRACVERLPSCDGREFQQNDPAGLPVSLVDLVAAPSRQIPGSSGLQGGFTPNMKLWYCCKSLISTSKIT